MGFFTLLNLVSLWDAFATFWAALSAIFAGIGGTL